MFGPIFKFLSVLNSETAPGQISLAFALSMVVGLTPFFGLQNFFIFFLVLILRVNISAFLLGSAFFSGLAYLLDPLFHYAGLQVLTALPLRGLWTELYNMTVFRLFRFNNWVMMGSLAVSIALFIPLFLVSNLLIRKYREHFLSWVNKTRVLKAYKASNFYKMYLSYNKLRNSI